MIMRALVLVALAAQPLLAQPDLSGTWVLNVTRSQSAQLPARRTLVIQRSGNSYTMRQIDGADTTKYMISLGGAGPTADLGDGASNLRYTAHVMADTIVYVVDLTSDQGLVGTQSGRLFLSDGGRVLNDVNELVATSEPVPQRLVFDRKR
jgi:hypothetical protein